MNPVQLAAGAGVIPRRHLLRMIEAASRDVDLVGPVVALKRQLRAAMGTEAARAFRARPETYGLARHQAILGRPDAEPSDERRARRSPADRAMAIGFVERRARDL